MRTMLERRAAAPEEAASFRSWEDLVDRYGWLLRIQVYRALLRAGFRADREPVEDWVQEAFYRLFAGGAPRLRRLRSLAGAQLTAYLGRVASGVVFDERRSRAAVKRGKGFRITLEGRLSEIADRAVDPRATPEQNALRRQRQRLFFDYCHALVDAKLAEPDRRRAVRILQRTFLAGWSSAEIIRAEGGRLAPSTVHSLVHRARRRISAAPLAARERRAAGTL
jgi:DNA-directed RNA polymerase specialized sigma24 family protein